MSLEERLFTARRAGCLEHLVRIGQTTETAEAWCHAWEAEAERRGWPRSAEFWEQGRLWIDAQITMRRSPGALVSR